MIDRIIDFLSTTHELTPFSLGMLVLVFAAAGFIMLPRILTCVLAGASYGFVAIPIAIPSTTVGSLIAFLVARYVAAAFVQRIIARKPALQRIARAVDQEGWRIVALFRFGAPVPGAFTNYLFGVTNINWWSFTWATFVFCIPQIVLFVSLGAAGRAALLEGSSALGQALIALAVITLAAILYRVTRRARAVIDEATAADDEAARRPAQS